MTIKSKSAAARLRAGRPVLITEPVEEFAALRKQLDDEIGPNGIVEQGFVDDLAAVMWEIVRLMRWKTTILNSAFCEALQRVLKEVWCEDFEDYSARDHAVELLAWQWLANESEAKEKVAELLDQHQLDLTAIEAEAFRMRAQELEMLARMVGLAEVRREKLLISIAAFRQGLGKLVRRVSDELLEQPVAPQSVAIVKRGG